MKYDIVDAFNKLSNSDSAWYTNSNTYESIKWDNNNTQTKPTKIECTDKLSQLEAEEPARLVRIERDKLLDESDWTQTRDNVRLNDSAWITYRQELRDITKSASFTPELNDNGTLDKSSVTWPLKPST
tara:strand:- start:15 stop:398 length:384 start_codon:yes stop_codon:yes gene_type:complete